MTRPASEELRDQLAIQEAVGYFQKQGAADWAPYIGVLGPPGCGKSGFLSNLRLALSTGPLALSGAHLLLDLRQVSIDFEEQMYARLATLCLHHLGSLSPRALEGRRAFEEVLRRALESQGRLTLYIDNFESVPQYFARTLSKLFRQFYQEREETDEYRHLGLVLAGSLSLFELKHDNDSVLSVSGRILLPFLDLERRSEAVRLRAADLGCEPLSADVLNRLADETGGEPAFLDPVLNRICRGRRNLILDEHSVSQAVEQLSALTTPLPILRSLALHIYSNLELFEIVRQLVTGKAYVAPRDPVVDIDRFHLVGAVVLDMQSEPQCYRFRNRMVERYCRGLLAQPSLQVRTMILKGGDPGEEADIDALERIRLRVHRAPRIWAALAELRKAWKLTTSCPDARVEVYLHAPEQVWWWFDTSHNELKSRPAGASDEAPLRAITAALRDRKPSFGLDAHEIAFAVPLRGSFAPFLVTVQFNRSEIDSGFGEDALIHWSRFVQEVAASLENHALAEFGRQSYKKSSEDAKAASLDADEAIRRVVELEVSRTLQVARLGLLTMIVSSIALALRWLIPEVVENFERLEPLESIITNLLSLIAIILALLGYRFDPLKVWERSRNGLHPRLVEWRMKRLKRRLQLQGTAEQVHVAQARSST